MANHICVSWRKLLLGSFALIAASLIVGVAAGLFFDSELTDRAQTDLQIPLHAAAAYGLDGYSIATGLVDNDLEGIFFLDALTGELNVAVLNPQTRKFVAHFKRKIAPDFKKGKEVKNPKYLLVTGVADLTEVAGSGGSLADSVIYVVEATSGIAACYAVQMPPNLRSKKDIYYGKIGGIDMIELRKTKVRPETADD